jgi:hypothetical protein
LPPTDLLVDAREFGDQRIVDVVQDHAIPAAAALGSM